VIESVGVLFFVNLNHLISSLQRNTEGESKKVKGKTKKQTLFFTFCLFTFAFCLLFSAANFSCPIRIILTLDAG
jgi:hypothetical protein